MDEKQLKLLKPCPGCGGHKLEFKYHISYGHGDCGFEGGRIVCKTCFLSKGNIYNYGHPSIDDEIKIGIIWNNLKEKSEIEKFTEKFKESYYKESDNIWDNLIAFKNKSLTFEEFLNKFPDRNEK